MAQKIHIVLEDALDGSEASQTVSFGLDGTSYEIDLNDENAQKLRDVLAPYVGHGRRVVASARRAGRCSAASASGPSAKEIGYWARANGHDVADRGWVSAEVRSAYEAAH